MKCIVSERASVRDDACPVFTGKMYHQEKCNNRMRPPMSRKEIKFFGTTSFDEAPSSPNSPSNKCKSPKFFRTQSFGVLSPKTSKKLLASIKDRNSNYSTTITSSSTSSVKTVAGSTDTINSSHSSFGGSCSSNSSNVSVNTLSVHDSIDENNEFVVASEGKVFDRLKRLRQRMRRSSISVEAYDYDSLRNQR